MSKTLLTIAGIGLLSAFFVYPAFSHNPGGYSMGHRMGAGYQMGMGHHNGPRHGDDALTEEQRSRIDKLSEGFAADTKETRQQLHQKAAELNAVLAAPTPDKAQALKIQRELNSLRNSMAEKRLELNLQVKKIAPEGMSGNAFCAGPKSGRRHMPW